VARVIARVVQDTARAEELAVDVFLKFWLTSSAHGPGAAAWLHRVAVRTGLDELRRRSRRNRWEQLFGAGATPRTPEELHSAEEDRLRVRSTLGALAARQAEMLILRSEGLSYQEIAEALGLNPASIGTLLSRAQETFRKEYIRRYGER
jgi:RNA polymerase sigma-70 factor (ECF subfamily)